MLKNNLRKPTQKKTAVATFKQPNSHPKCRFWLNQGAAKASISLMGVPRGSNSLPWRSKTYET